MARNNHGQVTLTANGTEYEMSPTPAALKAIEERFGSLVDCYEKLSTGRFTLSDMATIIRGGAGMPKSQQEQVEEDVFYEGIMACAEQTAEFLTALFDPSGNKGGLGDDEGKG